MRRVTIRLFRPADNSLIIKRLPCLDDLAKQQKRDKNHVEKLMM